MASFLSNMLIYLIPLLLLNQSLAASDSSFVAKACIRTMYPDICLATFNSDPRSAKATNTTDLSRIGIQLSASISNETCSYVHELMKNTSGYEKWAKLSVCHYEYKSSTYHVGVKGLKLFDKKNYTDAYKSVGSLNHSASRCNEMSLAELAERNRVALDFSDDVMTILRPLL